MSDDIELPDGTYAPIQDTVCGCGHWYDEHGPSGMYRGAEIARYLACRAPGCGCVSYVADPERSTADAVADRGGEPEHWPPHVKRGSLLYAIRDRVAGEGTPVASIEVQGGGDALEVEYLGDTYRLRLEP